MQIKYLALSAIVLTILAGLMTFMLSSVKLKGAERTQLEQKINTEVADRYEAGTISKTTIMLLLAIGLIGALGISRKIKADKTSHQNNEINEAKTVKN